MQVTKLKCGGMILCTGINHILCDAFGTSQFLNAWAHITSNPNSDLPFKLIHSREVLKPRCPPQVTFNHPAFSNLNPNLDQNALFSFDKNLHSQPLVATTITFNPSQILDLKRKMIPSQKCTTFEVLATHTWRAFVNSLNLSDSLNVKLIFSVNVRKNLDPELPQGYYGNGFVFGCAESKVKDLMKKNIGHGVELVQQAKSCMNDDYIRSMIDMFEDKKVKLDQSVNLILSQWSRLGLENPDFGTGKPLQMGPLLNEMYCLFLPVVKDPKSVRVLISMPQDITEKMEYYMTQY